MRLVDVLVNSLIDDYGVDTVFTVTGGGAMYLNDAFGSRPDKLKYIPMHHEQSAAMAAEGYSGVGNRLGVCQITTGPGGTNAITGCAGAWIDSRPILFISGQVESFSISGSGLRQTGVQEVKIVDLVKSITKAAVRLDDPYMILYELDRLLYLAKNARPGPVWLDIPLEIQNFDIAEPAILHRYVPQRASKRNQDLLDVKIGKLIRLLKSSSRPVFCVGSGAREASSLILEIAERYQIPISLGWNAKDFYPANHPLVFGSIGQFGNRSANIMISKADLIIGLGFRFSVPQIGYDPSLFGRLATIVSVDVDQYEIGKYSGFIDLGIVADAYVAVQKLNEAIISKGTVSIPNAGPWVKSLNNLQSLNFDSGPRDDKAINSFDFTDALSELIPVPSYVVTDMGTSFTCTHQQLSIKSGLRLFTSSGLASMGFGLPGAIGAFFAKSDDAEATLITGDGGLMFNLQELQTVVTYQMPLKIIIYENGGYLTMRLMQEARFKRLVGSGRTSNLDCADFIKIASAFILHAKEISTHEQIKDALGWLYQNSSGSKILVVHLNENQALTPRVQTQSTPDGVLLPGILDNMYPFLTDAEKMKVENLFNDA